jgi:hypothetical protein
MFRFLLVEPAETDASSCACEPARAGYLNPICKLSFEKALDAPGSYRAQQVGLELRIGNGSFDFCSVVEPPVAAK